MSGYSNAAMCIKCCEVMLRCIWRGNDVKGAVVFKNLRAIFELDFELNLLK
jgi:hypothetical protein